MEKYQKYGINPLLISVATGQDVVNLSPRPTVAMLPGKYSKLVYKHIKTVNAEFPENSLRLTCKKCDKSGDYDLGTIVFSTDVTEPRKEVDRFQALGYFRCKHCNAAGEWELSPRIQTMLAAKMAAATISSLNGTDRPDGIILGEAIIDRVFLPRWGSDAESYFLKKLSETPDNAYLWNRLGNTYYRGKRPELAVFAHEQALVKDAGQVESHYSIGKILIECGELEKASEHLRQAVEFSHQYKYMTAYDLREIIVGALEILLTIYKQSDNKINMLPKPNEQAITQLTKNQIAATAMLDFEIEYNSRETLYPLAEVYLGERRNELLPEECAIRKRNNKAVWPIASKVNKQKPSKKNKNRRKR
ncbi:tetratricopeptide repeat protein [Sporomusa sp. KB1]|uniref:tetratricopeptide repeat protein n=1 Tax=Sporomusa sp. KB1 TaxID=943346 RepID=UPI0011A98886|nr:hypothetical protein [Sporomusa sp. KB1]TWH46655.1 tetratricopeptide repeat protein [Sporomusa sp. KB1]